MSRGARLLIVGLDGATFDLVDRFVAEGRMPVMETLLREGCSTPLCSVTPAMTLPAWSTFLTGCNPGKHGIYDFTRRIPGTYGLEFTNATHRRVPTLHRILSDRGARVASIAVPTTYPPEPLNGVVISGFDSPVATSIDGSFVHPPGLYAELSRRFGRMRFADFQELRIGPGWHDAALDALLREIPRKQAIARHLLQQERWDALMVLFGETDTVSHHFWMFHDAKSPRHPSHTTPRLRDAIAEVYARCDAALGDLIDAADPDWVCIASDHGFGGAGDQVLFLNRFLEAHGWLSYRGRGTHSVAGHRTGTGLVDRTKAWALRTLPAPAQEQLVRRMPRRLLNHIESRSRYGDIDFARTRAWSDEMNYAATLHLNVSGRDPQGTVRDVDEAAAELTELFLAWEVEGQRVVREVLRAETVYGPDALPGAPDLILELNLPNGYSYTVLPSARAEPGQTSRALRPEERTGGKGLGMNGTHRQHGVGVLWGRGFAPSRRIDAHIGDCLPTLFTAMGEHIPDHVDGRVLQSAFIQRTRPTYTHFRGVLPEHQGLSGADAAEVRARLHSLGYL